MIDADKADRDEDTAPAQWQSQCLVARAQRDALKAVATDYLREGLEKDQEITRLKSAVMDFLRLATEFSETRRGYVRFLDLADSLEERLKDIINPI